MKKSLLTVSVFLALVLAFGLCSFAAEIEPNFEAYVQTLSDNDFASAIVYLRDRPDIKALDQVLHAERATMAVRHERVITALKQAADRSQPSLLSYLSSGTQAGTVEGCTPYWIMNLVVVSATKVELYRIADRPEVEAVEGNFEATLIEPVGGPSGPPIAGIGVTKSLRAINADLVWYNLGITGYGTLIGGLDTGVDGDHFALTDRWRGNWHPWQECWRDALGYGTTYPVDYHGHGTHTMGTMCGAGHVTGDTVGVAWEAWWIADNSINQSAGPEIDNDILGAFQWFADPDGDPGTTDDVPDVVQNSWGVDSRFGYDYEDCDYRWQGAIEACEAAGVVVTFSAGNEGPSPQTHRSPANICNTPTVNFSVGAVDAENYNWPYPIASWSSRGPSDCDGVTIKPEVVAPGVYVYSSYNNGGYTRMSGTSMAGPHVAGVVALMRQANPNADVQTIKTILMNTARDLGSAGEDNDYGWGCIDAYQAVLAVMEPDTIPPSVTVTSPNGGEVLTVGEVYPITWNATDNVGVARVSIYYSYDGGASYNFVDSLPGAPGSYDWIVPDTPSTQCLVKVYAYDGAGNSDSDVSDNFFAIQEDTEAPAVTVIQPNGGEVLTATYVYTIQWNASDNVGITSTDIDYTYDAGNTWVDIVTLDGNPGSYDWTVPGTPSAQCLVRVTCVDAATNSGFDVSDNFFTIQEAPANYVWVKSIDMSLVTRGPNKNARAEVLIWDQDNSPVFKGEVHGHWDGLTHDADVFITKKDGRGYCDSDKLTGLFSGWWYFYVDDVVKSGYVFRSDMGETVDSIWAGVPLTARLVPNSFSISQNYPNPFNPVTQFSIDLPSETHVSFVVYNVAGQKVRTLVDETIPAGVRTIAWDSTNDRGEVVAGGIYLYRVVAGNNVVTNKMLLLK